VVASHDLFANLPKFTPPTARPFGRVLTFDLPGLGTIYNLNTTGNLNIISAGGPSDYTSGEAVYLEFATPDPFRPQRTGTGVYGVEYVTATAVVNPATNLLSGLVRTGNPKLGYKSTDVFVVLKVGGGSPASPALVSVNTTGTGITDIDGSLYSDAVLNGLIAITQIPLGADPTAFGAKVFVNANTARDPIPLTAAEITPAESDIMSTTNGIFTVGDLFIVNGGDVNGIIRVATITPVPAVLNRYIGQPGGSQSSDRARFSGSKLTFNRTVPSRGNSTKRSKTSMRPGSQAPGGIGVDVKHNSYQRYLLKKKGLYALQGVETLGINNKRIENNKYRKGEVIAGCKCIKK